MTAPVVRPLADVPAPTVIPARYGLYAAASLPTPDMGRWLGGVQYATDACTSGGGWPALCGTGDDPGTKAVDGLTLIGGAPFVVFDGITCTPAGLGDVVATARRRLELSEQRLVEEAFWTGRIGGRALDAGPVLADPDMPVEQIVAGEPGAPVSLLAGVAALEQVMGATYAGTAVLHAPRYAAPCAAAAELVVQQSGGPLRTPLGSMWAFGGGYPGTGPTGGDLNPAEVWLFATGAVVVRRSPISAHATFDGGRNVQTAIAERLVVVTAECQVWAAVVNLEEA